MATILPSAPSEGPKVTGLTATGVRVDGTLIEHAFMLTATGLTEWDGRSLDAAIALSPEFILLGLGPEGGAAPADMRETAALAGLGLEAMDTRQAAKAWNLLRSEGRQVVGLFLPLA